MSFLETIEIRNARVDADKAWETSNTRRVCIAILTYIVAFIYMTSIGVDNVVFNALIPVGGYLMSTLSLRAIKKMWLKNLYQGNQ
jgi:hypothetical protein